MPAMQESRFKGIQVPHAAQHSLTEHLNRGRLRLLHQNGWIVSEVYESSEDEVGIDTKDDMVISMLLYTLRYSASKNSF